MQLNLTLNLTLNLRCNLDVNVDLSMLRLSRCPCILQYYGHCSVIIRWWCNPRWSLFQLSFFSFLLCFLLLLFLASIALSKLSFFFLITSDLNRHFGATSASLRIENRAFTQPLCSQAIHTDLERGAKVDIKCPRSNKGDIEMPSIQLVLSTQRTYTREMAS